MADFTIKRNDTAPALGPFTLRDADGAAVNLTGTTSRKLTVRTTGGAVLFSAPCQTIDLATGRLSYQWSAANTATAGQYEWEVEVTWGDGRKQTFPTIGSMTLEVAPDLDAQ